MFCVIGCAPPLGVLPGTGPSFHSLVTVYSEGAGVPETLTRSSDMIPHPTPELGLWSFSPPHPPRAVLSGEKKKEQTDKDRQPDKDRQTEREIRERERETKNGRYRKII